MSGKHISRRRFLSKVGVGSAVAFAVLNNVGGIHTTPLHAALADKTSGDEGHSILALPPLPYDYNALEPIIDEQTMRIHHGRHHAAYVNNLATALKDYPELQKKSLAALLYHLNDLPETIRTSVRNNGGGHSNHSIFWAIMGPNSGSEPSGALAKAITATFGDLAQLKVLINDAGLKQFGSGWTWLVLDRDHKLQVYSTPNQDSPYMQGHTPLLGIDVWEHAYYLKYQNQRGAYLNAWWNVVNWKAVGHRYDQEND